jgi:hypothetical protein
MKISELLQKFPETDREIQARLPPPETPEEQKRRRRDQLPESWGNASKLTGPDPALARQLAAQVFTGGRRSIVELIRALDNADDYKPEYLLRCMAVYGSAREKKLLARTLGSQLEASSARAILIRELQFIASDESARALGEYLTDEKLCADAAAALTAIGGSAAASEFRKALSKAAGKCRVTIVQNLGLLRDTRSRSSDLLRRALHDSDPDVRLTAGWALARIGDVESIGPLIKIADAAEGYTRVKATNTILLLAETLATGGKRSEAVRIYTHIQNTRTDPKEKYIRETAARHLSVFML